MVWRECFRQLYICYIHISSMPKQKAVRVNSGLGTRDGIPVNSFKKQLRSWEKYGSVSLFSDEDGNILYINDRLECETVTRKWVELSADGKALLCISYLAFCEHFAVQSKNR